MAYRQCKATGDGISPCADYCDPRAYLSHQEILREKTVRFQLCPSPFWNTKPASIGLHFGAKSYGLKR